MSPLQTASLTDMSDCYAALAMTDQGPVALLEEQRVAGVLVSWNQWNTIVKILEAAQECLATFDALTDTKYNG
ncbi:MAG: hypothetical protein KDE19_10515 [Caldilineaceae bacterium]|nr:hypothetical protein [Caldilineaceae bacterium]